MSTDPARAGAGPASTGPASAGPASTGFDTGRRYRLHPQVVLRPEPFGALAYHHGNRRLTFLRSPALAELVRALDRGPSAQEAMEDLAVEPARRPALLRALAQLARSEVILAD